MWSLLKVDHRSFRRDMSILPIILSRFLLILFYSFSSLAVIPRSGMGESIEMQQDQYRQPQVIHQQEKPSVSSVVYV